MRVMLTGAAGFVGHHVAEALERAGHEVVALVRMGKIGDLERLNQIGFTGEGIWHDLRSPIPETVERRIGTVDAIIHMGAETHVDRSIEDASEFVWSNVVGTMHLLEFARKRLSPKGRFIQFSTDEVFGPAPDGIAYKEDDAHNPKNPYAASKSGAEALVVAYNNTYGIPATIVRSMNIFGERQHREKFIPKVIHSVITGTTVPIHSDKTMTRAGSRYYTYAGVVADVLVYILGMEYEGMRSYHVVGEREVDNLQMAEEIAKIMHGELKYEMVNFHESRPGHDLRYALADTRLEGIGWTRKTCFEEALAQTVQWYLSYQEWLGL